MDHDLHSRLTYELKILKSNKSRLSAQLNERARYKNMLLKRRLSSDGHSYYYVKTDDDTKYRYAGTGSDERVLRIKEAACLKESLIRIDRDIDLIQGLMNDYLPYDLVSVNSCLPLSYRSISGSGRITDSNGAELIDFSGHSHNRKTSNRNAIYRTDSHKSSSHRNGTNRNYSDQKGRNKKAPVKESYIKDVSTTGIHSFAAYQAAGMKWKSEKLVFQKAFPENFPNHKTETASDGTKVKTVSEIVMYERFLAEGFYFIYELPVPSEDYGPNLYPDFTILSPLDCETEIIVEYVGRLDLPQYREDFARRVYRYMKNGYYPGVNLFFVFSDLDGHVDSLQINKIIADILGLR